MSHRAWEFIIEWTAYFVVMGLIAGAVFLLIMSIKADGVPQRCWIEFSTNNNVGEYVLFEQLDWAPDHELGRFVNRNEAVEVARLNGCPLPGDTGKKHVEEKE